MGWPIFLPREICLQSFGFHWLGRFCLQSEGSNWPDVCTQLSRSNNQNNLEKGRKPWPSPWFPPLLHFRFPFPISRHDALCLDTKILVSSYHKRILRILSQLLSLRPYGCPHLHLIDHLIRLAILWNYTFHWIVNWCPTYTKMMMKSIKTWAIEEEIHNYTVLKLIL